MTHFSKFLTASVAALAFGSSALANDPEWAADPDHHFTIHTLVGQMKYDQTELEVQPGDKVKLTLVNSDDLQHNLILLDQDPDDKTGMAFSQAAWQLGEEGMKLGWVPENDPRMLVASALLNPEETQDLYFVAPDEPGDYPYVCTVPGHAMAMNGKLKVVERVQLLHDLTWKRYEGSWKNLPNFYEMEAVEEGEIDNGLMNLAMLNKGNVGLVFTGEFRIERNGQYEFFLTSDDGSRLVIDGEEVVSHDGIHPAGSIQKQKIKMTEGQHTFEMRYFDGGGHRVLSLEVQGPGIGRVALTENIMAGKAAKPQPDPIMLAAENAGEAVLYRNFIQGSLPRGIAVGYPGNVSVCWDADALNLAMIWRGAFMDASRHWTNRGQGNQPPAGFDIITPGAGLPLQVLESPETPWQREYKIQFQYDRDKGPDERTTEKSVPGRHPDYRFRGYRLDEKRFPTFRYEFQDLTVEDGFASGEHNGIETVERSVSFTGTAADGTHFRLSDKATAADDGWFNLDGDTVRMKVEGADTVLRNKELLVPIAGETQLKITYAWTQAVGGQVSAN